MGDEIPLQDVEGRGGGAGQGTGTSDLRGIGDSNRDGRGCKMNCVTGYHNRFIYEGGVDDQSQLCQQNRFTVR